MSGHEHSGDPKGTAENRNSLFPADFTQDEISFAEIMRACYRVEEEELPPDYVRTIMGDSYREPLAPTYERDLAERVFERLGLDLPPSAPPSRAMLAWPLLVEAMDRVRRFRRASAGAVGMLVSLTLLSALLLTQAAAAGLDILLGQTGVRQVITSPAASKLGPLLIHATGQAPHYWLGAEVSKYEFSGMRDLPAEFWSAGPIRNLQYHLPGATAGTGVLDLRAFKVSPLYAAVRQDVRAGSARVVDLNGTPAIYVDGAWNLTPQHATWQPGVRCSLLFERAGTVFWLVADQRDGAGLALLLKAASQLTQFERTPDVMPLLGIGPFRSFTPNDPAAVFTDLPGDEIHSVDILQSGDPSAVSQLVQYERGGRQLTEMP